MNSTQRAITPKEEATILGLIADEARALKEVKLELALRIGEQMRREFAGVLCLVCGHEAHLHSPTICAGGKGDYGCDCPGIKLRREADEENRPTEQI